MSLFFLVLTIALAAALMTAAVRGYAERRLLDVPNSRSSHRRPTPRGGGLAIVAAFTGAAAYLRAGEFLAPQWTLALAGALPVAVAGFWDDHGHVPVKWRLAAQFTAAAWSLYWLGGLDTLRLGGESLHLGWPGHLLGLLFIVWLLNLFNFMDGIDGIAGTEAVTAALAGGLLALGYGPPESAGAGAAALALAAASLGFLVWNWPPAKIFMGDVGSGFVGFLLALLALGSARAGGPSLVVWLILAGVFFTDATVTLLRRMLSGRRWYEAHCSHAYQQAARRLGGHRPVTLAVLGINLLWLLPLALASVRWPRLELAFATLAYAPLVGLAFRFDAGKERT